MRDTVTVKNSWKEPYLLLTLLLPLGPPVRVALAVPASMDANFESAVVNVLYSPIWSDVCVRTLQHQG